MAGYEVLTRDLEVGRSYKDRDTGLFYGKLLVKELRGKIGMHGEPYYGLKFENATLDLVDWGVAFVLVLP
jgi:hypothetical protein